jgi:hypothetical protein
MAVYFVSMESTAGYGMIAGDRVTAPDAATARKVAEAVFLARADRTGLSAEDCAWLDKAEARRAPRIAAGYVMRARKVRL